MNSHLVLLDFDGTIANTFADSPRGMNVNVASRLAISEVFGRNGALAFDESGGLRNREPGELVRDIGGMVRANGLDVAGNTEWFVAAKLSRLTAEISPEWPQLYPGAKGFLQKASRDGYWADVGILSSGHDGFISRVLEVNGIDPSSMIMVTSDLIRQREMPKRPRFKPNPYQFAEAHRQWLVKKGILPVPEEGNGDPFVGRNYGKDKILYVGDDPIKDGGLALESRVPFVFVPFTKPGYEPLADKGQMSVRDFLELDDVLDYQHGDQLAKGWSFAEALFGRPDVELFPPRPDGEVYRRIVGERTFI
jgi:phosphoglycolate phosphatase-like HAD superfamily hydrolase